MRDVIIEISKYLRAGASRTTFQLWLLSGLVLAVTGPFGSIASLGLWQRLAYWLAVVGCSFPIAYLCRGTVEVLLSKKSLLVRDAGFLTLFSVLFTPVSVFITRLRFDGPSHTQPGFLEMFGYVYFITLAITVFRRQFTGLEGESYFTVQKAPELPRLHQRLPSDFQGPILRLTARDHIVEVVNVDTTVEVRMRFTDAITEMDGVIGYCAHRSHWVAAIAIVGTVRDGARTKLRLGNGDLVPVSRKYRPVLENAGIL